MDDKLHRFYTNITGVNRTLNKHMKQCYLIFYMHGPVNESISLPQYYYLFMSTCVHPCFHWGSCCSTFSMVFYVVFCRAFVLLSFFFWAIVLSALLPFTNSNFPFESSCNSSKTDILNDCFNV